MVTGYGAWFWINAAYSYLMIGYGTFLLVRHVYLSSAAYRRQSHWLLIGALIPIAFNLVYVFRVIPGLQKDFTTIAFTFSGIAFAIGIYRFQLFSLAPLARDFIIDQIRDGYLITDDSLRISDINPAAEEIFDVTGNDILGQPVTQILPDLEELVPEGESESFQFTTSIELDSETKHFDVKVNRIKYMRRWTRGSIIMLRDITERVNLLRKVEQLAIIDDLTQVFNRRHFFYLAENALKLAVRYQRPLSIIMLDLDHFKEINDRYGHGAGDVVLQGFAKNAERTLRESDTFARFGGEEFIVLLPETSLDEALVVAERLRAEIANMPIVTNFGEIPLTISLGISSSTLVNPPLSLEKLVDRADRALYQAKHSGRNRVIVYDPEMPPVHPPRTIA
jgi:diguanylate cyclase (GGDEF)-like protein/PAS domain S-box-containing protein